MFETDSDYREPTSEQVNKRKIQRVHDIEAVFLEDLGKPREREQHLNSFADSRDSFYYAFYGISEFDYQELWQAQDGRCKICGVYKDLDGKRHGRLFVDHDHATGEVRALLCGHCNSLIGYAKDSPDIIRAAAAYLEHYNELAAQAA